MSKIGFSLSFCVRDIAEGRVKYEDVHHIVTGCSPENEQQWMELLDQYAKTYWRNCPTAKEIARDLNGERKLMFCSTWRKSPPNIGAILQSPWLDWPE